MDVSEAYRLSRAQLVDQAAGLDESQAGAPVPATPGWSVKDAYAHLTGVTADVLAGRMDDAGSPAWTARQVAERSDCSLAQICDEWAGRAEAFDAWLAEAGDPAMFCVYDVWTHQQDIQGALGLDGVRDDRLEFLLERALIAFDDRLRRAAGPAIRIHGESQDRVIGAGETSVELRSGDYEIMRLLFGRRSRRQVDQWYWHGDWEPCLDHLHLFDLAEVSLID